MTVQVPRPITVDQFNEGVTKCTGTLNPIILAC